MMTDNLKYIVGQAREGETAVIRFFDGVDYLSAELFKEEFLYLQNQVKPSKIVVMINSEGGLVIPGMSMFSLIQSCPIEVDCVIEGIAASMGSVIWSAGDNLYMHDYSLLMIHNPFSSTCEDGCDENTKCTIDAFKHQLATIYKKRFELTSEQVRSIMDGEGEADGTFFTAQEAVKAGFIDKNHVIKTSKAVRDKAKAMTRGIEDKTELRNIMSSLCVCELDEKQIDVDVTINNKNDNNKQKTEKEMNEKNFDAISAMLGFQDNAQVSDVMARVNALSKAEAELSEINSKYTELEIQFKGKEAEVANLNSELEDVKASLKMYKDAEQKAFEEKIETMVNSAIEAGKIDQSAKDSWLKMANTDFATVENTLKSIPAREKITDAIANDPINVANTEDAVKDAYARMQEKVAEVLGEKIEYKKF